MTEWLNAELTAWLHRREIMTKCVEMPYNDLETPDLLAALERGYRMPCPPLCPESVYSIMLACWHHDPHHRTEFAQLFDALQAALLDLRASMQKQASMRLKPVGSTRHPPRHTQDPNTHNGRSYYENVTLQPPPR